MSVVPKPEALQRRGGRWFKSGTAQIHLGVDSKFTAVKKAHPGIVVEGFDELVERLKSFNINFVLDDEIPQLRRMYIEDPFGNRIEIIDQRSLSDLPY
jgi:extradiol dioxygenase family protein